MQKMYEVDHRYLKFVNFSSVESWSSYSILGRKLDYTKQFHFVKIGKFLRRNKTAIKIEDDKAYKRATIKINGNGIFLRDEVLGNVIGTKNQFLITAKQFLLSKIDARNGAFGVVPNELDGGIITGNFWTFDVDYSIINPHFLTLITKTKAFQNLCQTASVGTTNRNYLQERDFLNFQIPLPTITEQKAILDDYQQKIENAKQLETEVQTLEQSIEKYLFEELGIVENKSVSKKGFGLRFFDFSNIDRWDVWTKKNLFESSKYKYQNFEKIIIGKPLYGANVKGVHKHSNTRYIRITDINESGDLNNDFVSPEFVEEKYLLQENDFLIARSGNTVGKTFLYKNHFGRAIYAGYLIKFNINSNIAFPEYVFEFTKSKIFKDWINSNQRISGQPNINGQEYLSAPFLIPPLEKQKEIAEHISTIKDNIKSLKQNAETLKAEAEREFEEKIFN